MYIILWWQWWYFWQQCFSDLGLGEWRLQRWRHSRMKTTETVQQKPLVCDCIYTQHTHTLQYKQDSSEMKAPAAINGPFSWPRQMRTGGNKTIKSRENRVGSVCPLPCTEGAAEKNNSGGTKWHFQASYLRLRPTVLRPVAHVPVRARRTRPPVCWRFLLREGFSSSQWKRRKKKKFFFFSFFSDAGKLWHV